MSKTAYSLYAGLNIWHLTSRLKSFISFDVNLGAYIC